MQHPNSGMACRQLRGSRPDVARLTAVLSTTPATWSLRRCRGSRSPGRAHVSKPAAGLPPPVTSGSSSSRPFSRVPPVHSPSHRRAPFTPSNQHVITCRPTRGTALTQSYHQSSFEVRSAGAARLSSGDRREFRSHLESVSSLPAAHQCLQQGLAGLPLPLQWGTATFQTGHAGVVVDADQRGSSLASRALRRLTAGL